jgi:hypothetical protein
MAIVYTDPEIILARYQAGEPVVDDYQADVIEGLQFLWRRHAQLILAYVPRVPFETLSVTPTKINSSTDNYAEDLQIRPATFAPFRPGVSGVLLTVTVIHTKAEVTVDAYDADGLIDSVNIIGAGTALGAWFVNSAQMNLTGALGDVWFDITVNSAFEDEECRLRSIYIYSSYAAGAPK